MSDVPRAHLAWLLPSHSLASSPRIPTAACSPRACAGPRAASGPLGAAERDAAAPGPLGLRRPRQLVTMTRMRSAPASIGRGCGREERIVPACGVCVRVRTYVCAHVCMYACVCSCMYLISWHAPCIPTAACSPRACGGPRAASGPLGLMIPAGRLPAARGSRRSGCRNRSKRAW